ncbi:MAG: S8 family serine peptidase [Candidatus Contendobacter sp.]|nr:S8 family serine peptidase [Candidatus Contendobacter sp.]
MRSKWLYAGISIIATMAGAFTVNNAVFGQENLAGSSPDTAKLTANVPANPLNPKYTAIPRVSSDLVALYYEHLNYQQRGGFQTLRQPFASTNQLARLVEERVVIDAVAQQDAKKLLADLEALGLRNGVAFGRIVSGQLPINTITTMAHLNSLNFVRPAYAMTNAGLVTSQGDQAMRANIARTTFSLDGAGVKIGTLSDSYNCLGGATTDVASGDLPTGVTVLQEIRSCAATTDHGSATDEGRAMMQLIHDVAPGSTQAFHTAFDGMADFAQGIVDLADAGATVIVDDVSYLTAPFFQDGIIAQAVNQVAGRGVAYFSSAGNQARKSYESAFRPSGIFDPVYGEFHDFDPGPGVDIYQSFSIPPSGSARISLQWDQPYFSVSGSPGSASDLALLIYNSSYTTLLGGSDQPNIGSDPVEFAHGTALQNSSTTTTANRVIAIAKKNSGPYPSLIKYIAFGNMTITEHNTSSSTTFGHANAAGAEATGAAFYYSTPAFGTTPPTLESFSSAGGTPILFEVNGTRKTQPEVRQKPEIVGPDGTNNTFFGTYAVADGDSYPNFFGTSAAAPHAAAVAALLRQAAPNLSPDGVYGFMERTAIDMRTPGFDYDSGFGLVQADAALTCPQTTLALTPNQWRMIGLPCNVGSNNTVEAVFGDNLNASVYDQRWAVFEWNANTQSYIKLGLNSPVEAGRGYWIKTLDSSQTIDAAGMLNNPLLPSLAAAPPGWNMAGHPFTFSVCWADVKVVDGTSQLTLEQADPGGACEQSPPGTGCVMSRIMHKWNGSAYQPFDGLTAGAEGTLEVFDGWWVKAKNSIKLLIPDTPVLSCTQAAAPTLATSIAEAETEAQTSQAVTNRSRYPAPRTRRPEEWGLRLIVEADDLVDPGNLLGRLSDSVEGPDQHDLKELSPFDTSKFLTIVFPHSDWGAYAGDYTSDYRAVTKRGNSEWSFEVRSDRPRTITLSWAGPDDVLQHSKLKDDETNKTFNPNLNNTYTVVMTKPVHRFRWRVDGGR